MSKYTDRISNYHAGKPKFFAHVDLSTRPLIDISQTMAGMISAFDIDTAVGKQLDISWRVDRAKAQGEHANLWCVFLLGY